MSKPIILRTDGELNMGGSLLSELDSFAEVVTAENDSVKTLIQSVKNADFIFTCYAPINSDVLNAGRKLRGIVKYGVGTDNIDLDAARALDIPVVHCPHYGTDTVAEHAFALMLSVARQTPKIDRHLHQKGWLWPDPNYSGVELAGKELGIIGYGRIGKTMARLAQGFSMTCPIYDPYVTRRSCDPGHIDFTSLSEVVRRSDFLSLHCVLTSETWGIIDSEQLRKMKPSAFLINVSRGSLIEEKALVEALANREIAGAGLDVFSSEPLAKDHPLLAFDNVVMSPHFAFYTHDAYLRLERSCLHALLALIKGEPLSTKYQARLVSMPDVSRQMKMEDLNGLRVEGDVNFTATRQVWQKEHISEVTQSLLDDDAKVFVQQSLSTPCLNALSACEGIYIQDAEGRRIMDFHGNNVHQVGYGNPRVLKAIQEQLQVLSFCPRRYTNQIAVDLAEKLSALAPGNLNKVLLTPSGTAAVGIAMKLARYVTGRHGTVSMWDSFHGASLDAISIGGESLFRDGLGPLMPGSHHVPWPRREEDAEHIKTLFDEHAIGAVIAEPLRCTTMERPEDGYWHRVRELCDTHGALLVFDEIPLALGRTGKMFCCEHSGVVPDALVIGKGLGGGVMPMAAVLIKGDLDRFPDRAIGHYTHEKSPVGAAAAMATLEVIEEDALLENSCRLGAIALSRITDLKSRCERIRDARGLGLTLAVELEPSAVDDAEQILYNCLKRGLSFKVSSGNVLTLTPPLVITEQELHLALDILESEVLKQLS